MSETVLNDPERWLSEHGDALYRYAMMRLRNADQAEDVVQETFLAALKARENFSGRSSERTWLIGILKHKIIDLIRKRTRERPVTELTADEESEEAFTALFDEKGQWKDKYSEWRLNPNEALDKKEFRQALVKCMQGLPGRQAEAFTLHTIEGMKGPEVCKVLDITPTNLWAMLHRARTKLKGCLEANYVQDDQGIQE